jgi:hypothetical protein
MSKGEKTTYIYKLFRVKRSDGRVTTVSVDPALFMKACHAMGGMKPVATRVRQAALEYQEGGVVKSCSGYVQAQLRTIVSNKGVVPAAAPVAAAPQLLAA